MLHRYRSHDYPLLECKKWMMTLAKDCGGRSPKTSGLVPTPPKRRRPVYEFAFATGKARSCGLMRNSPIHTERWVIASNQTAFGKYQASKLHMVVANYLSLLQELVRYNRDTHPAQSAGISLNLSGSFTPIAAQNGGGDGSPIDDHAIEKPLVGMIIYGANVIRERIAVRFARLGHKVGYIDAFRPRPSNRVRNAAYQQIGNQAGIEGAGAQENQVRLRSEERRV